MAAKKKVAKKVAKKATKKVAKKAVKKVVKKAATKKAAAKKATKKVVKKAAKKVTKKAAGKVATQTVELSVYSPDSGVVEIAGTFNGWVPAKMKKSAEGYWSIKLKLGKDSYQYKLVFDGISWEVDRNAPVVVDEEGNENNLLEVK